MRDLYVVLSYVYFRSNFESLYATGCTDKVCIK